MRRSAPGAVTDTPAGRVRGVARDGALEFLGVPFAAAKRLTAPGDPASWSGVRDASQPGPAPPQPDRPVARATHGPCPPQSEDCLTLNVWTPSLAGRRPVLVWLHGGGFTVGHATASLYRGAELAATSDVVVVAPAYRLGSLGWLGHPSLAEGPGAPAANWGLLDQIAALHWVREAIAGFGGDPARVTVAGQSAGALSAMDLLVAPGAAGLFRRLILQSPPLVDLAQPAQRAAEWAQALSRHLDPAAGGDPAGLAQVPAQRIVAAHEQLLDTPAFRGTRGGALPTLDPATIPVSPLDVPGATPAVDVLIGSTADEGTFFFGAPWRPAPPAERIPGIVAHLTGDDPDEALQRAAARAAARGGRTDPLGLLQQVATEAMVAAPVAAWAARRARSLHPVAGMVHRYRIDHPGAGPELGATHTCEVPLLFGTWHDGGPGERLGGSAPSSGTAAATAPTEAVAAAVREAWTGFIRGGDPGWEPLPAGGAGAEPVAVFGGPAPVRVEAPAPA